MLPKSSHGESCSGARAKGYRSVQAVVSEGTAESGNIDFVTSSAIFSEKSNLLFRTLNRCSMQNEILASN